MNQSGSNADVVDLFTITRILWRGKIRIAIVAFFFAVLGVVYALMATPIYRATAVLVPNEGEDRSQIPGSLGGLASLAGITLGTSADSTEALAILRSRSFAAEFINDFELLPVLFADEWDPETLSWLETDPEEQPDIRDGVRYFTEQIHHSGQDEETGLVTLSIDWTDAEVAASWANELISRINDRLRSRDLKESERKLAYLYEKLDEASLVELRQAILQLIQSEIQSITVAQGEEEYAFRVIDPPQVPKEKYSPMRAMIVALAGAFGLVSGAIWVLARAGWEERSESGA